MEPAQPISQPAEFTPSPRKRGKNKKLLIAALALVLLAGAAFGFSRMNSGSTDELSPTPEFTLPTEEPTPTASVEEEVTPTEEVTQDTEEEEPTPTEKPAATKSSELNIQVLNGSGEVGVAGTAEQFLSGKGYEFIETGNADNYDYEGVTIKSKESVSDYVSTLKSDLEEKYTITEDTGTLSDDSLFDVVVIVGK